MFTTTFPDPLYDKSENRMIREINDCIMLTMYYINQNISKYDLKKVKVMYVNLLELKRSREK